MEKSRARSSRCCGLALSHGLVLNIGLTALHLSYLERNDFALTVKSEAFP